MPPCKALRPYKDPVKGYRMIMMCFVFHVKIRDIKHKLLAFFHAPGGFREVREACRNNFYLCWYLSVSVVTSYG